MRYQFLSAKQLRAPIPEEYEAHGTLIVMPFIDAARAQEAARQLTLRANADGLLLCVHDDEREGFVSIANQAFAMSSHERVGYVAQDAFAGRHWLRMALDVFATRKPGLLAFNDGKWLGELASFGLVDRRWALGNYGGPLFHPGYRSHYADVELTLLARHAGRYAYEANAVLVEIDAEKDVKPVSEQDRDLFLSRRQSGFEGRVKDTALLEKFQ